MQTPPRPESPYHPGDPDEHGERPHPDVRRELGRRGHAPTRSALLDALRAADDWRDGRAPRPAPGLTEEQRHALPELSGTLDELHQITRAEPGPGGEAAPRVSALCLRVALWAERERLGETALAFAVLASDAAPADPGPAYHVGRLCLAEASRWSQSRRWLRWSVRMAGRDPGLLSRALLALSRLTWHDNDARALAQVRRARTVARRARLHELEGDALRRMADLHFRAGSPEEAAAAALEAVDAYGGGHRRVEELAFEVALRWLEDVGDAGGATDLFVLLAGSSDPARVLLAHACTARAAAYRGREALYEAAAFSAAAALQGSWKTEAPVAALLHLARAAHLLGYEVRAAVAAGMACDRARVSGDVWAQQDALDMLHVMAHDDAPAAARERLFPELRHLPEGWDAEADDEERPRGPAAEALLQRLRDVLFAELRTGNPGAMRRVCAAVD